MASKEMTYVTVPVNDRECQKYPIHTVNLKGHENKAANSHAILLSVIHMKPSRYNCSTNDVFISVRMACHGNMP